MAKPVFDNYIRFSAQRLTALGAPGAVSAFLATTGLPEWCAPHMHFGWVGDPSNVLPLRQTGSEQYIGLGEDQDDNPVWLAVAACDVWVLPAQGSPVYVASNVQELSASLHQFQACIDAAVAGDPMAFVEARVTTLHLQAFASWAKDTNPALVRPGTFWARELARLGLAAPWPEPDGLPEHRCP